MDWRSMAGWYVEHYAKGFIRFIVIATITIPFLIYAVIQKDPAALQNFFDSGLFIMTTALLLSEAVTWIISKWLQRGLEDRTKLTEDYEGLMDKYSRVDLIEYNHKRFPGEAIAFRGKDSGPFRFEFFRDTIKETYSVPTQIAEKSKELMKAHNASVIYNSDTVRKKVTSLTPYAEHRLDDEDTERLAKLLMKLLRGEISLEDAALSEDVMTADDLRSWKNRAELEFKRLTENSPTWLYRPESPLAGVIDGK